MADGVAVKGVADGVAVKGVADGAAVKSVVASLAISGITGLTIWCVFDFILVGRRGICFASGGHIRDCQRGATK